MKMLSKDRWVLPPKRFEEADDSKYDPIRSRRWFARLLERKWQIPLLRHAHKLLLMDCGLTQETVCEEMVVDARELRDYIKFHHGQVAEVGPNLQGALDYAYDMYCMDGAKMSWRAHMESGAKAFGLNPRHLMEQWEIDSGFYPTGLNENK